MTKFKSKALALCAVIVIVCISTVSAFAGLWTFGTGGQGQFSFEPRGYSIVVNGTNTWMSSLYDPDGAIAGSQYAASYTGTASGQSTISAGQVTIYAWLDKNPMGSTMPSYYGENYKDYLVVSTNSGSTWQKLNGMSGVTISDACRTVTDPDTHTNQWCIPITMTLSQGTTYTFGFYRGFQANNSNTLALYSSTTTGGQAGYIGYVAASSPTPAEYTMYNNQRHTLYQYINGLTSLGTDSSGRTVYSLSLLNFYYTISAT